jgi:catechol 2,3-dioxygenase-like lactoylglutathione lyase family enzyme
VTCHAIHHTSFTVSDVDAAEDWFVRHFGMVRLGGGDYDFDYIRSQVGIADAVLRIAMLGFPGEEYAATRGRIELIEYRSGGGLAADTATNRPGNAHLCFLTSDIDADHRRLSAAGVRFLSGPNTVTWGINRGARAVYMFGPDDIRLELLQPAPAPLS